MEEGAGLVEVKKKLLQLCSTNNHLRSIDMSKLACALAIAALLMLCAPARSADSGLDSSLGMESEMQLQLLETEIAQISVSEKQLHDIVALQAQAGGDELTEAEKGTMAKLQALEQEQKKRMLTDDEFNLPITLMEHHEKCNAQIIEAVLKIFRTAKMQVCSRETLVRLRFSSSFKLSPHFSFLCASFHIVYCQFLPPALALPAPQVRSQISKVEAYLTSADYARHLIQMMK